MTLSEQTRPIQIGDSVAYNWQILQNRGWYLRDFLQGRGTVTGLVQLPSTVQFRIAWDRPGLPTIAGPQELCRLRAERKS